ncbi:MAG: DUF427 domain-containing protein [Cystobacter sp.]
MKATYRGRVIADSAQVIEVGGYHYFPRESVRMELLSASPKTDSDRACPHGVQFYDVSEAGSRSERAAWSYEAPQTSMKKVDQWMGFWGEVELSP